jgi:hypothetical protein
MIGLLAVVVLILLAIITHTYIVRPRQVQYFRDWFAVLLPLLPPFVALLSSLLLWRNPERKLLVRCVVWGACVSCGAYMVLQIWLLLTQFTLISQDGEAHWGSLQLPVFYIALPLLFLGLVIGALVGLMLKRRLPKHALQPTPLARRPW